MPVTVLGELSLQAVDVLWEDLRLGGVPFPLEVPGHGGTLDERARIRAGVYAELERRGLARSGRLAAELEDALGLLAKPEVSVDLVARVDSGWEPVRALAVTRGRRALRAVQRAPKVELSGIRDTAVVASIVDLLPAERPGPGRSVTVPVSALQRGRGRAGMPRPASGTSGADIQLIESIMERPVRRVGQLGVMLRDEHGVRRLPGIAWFDTDQGRYASTVRRGGDGEDWTSLAPADNARLAQRLVEMLVSAAR